MLDEMEKAQLIKKKLRMEGGECGNGNGSNENEHFKKAIIVIKSRDYSKTRFLM